MDWLKLKYCWWWQNLTPCRDSGLIINQVKLYCYDFKFVFVLNKIKFHGGKFVMNRLPGIRSWRALKNVVSIGTDNPYSVLSSTARRVIKNEEKNLIINEYDRITEKDELQYKSEEWCEEILHTSPHLINRRRTNRTLKLMNEMRTYEHIFTLFII